MDLFRKSIQIILENQAESGAYIASPNFPTYHYCWFRDGSFIAYSMNLVKQHESAARFHAWAARAVNRRLDVVNRGIDRAKQGLPLREEDVLHTRYTLDGEDGTKEEWPNFQVDGFGTWLWALEQYRILSGRILPVEWLSSADAVADYISALWDRPCYDCWEEFPDQIHTHTLAAIYGGLQAYSRLRGKNLAPILDSIKNAINSRAVADGHFLKFPGNLQVDASLVGLAVPYGVAALNEPRMADTVDCIEKDLRRGGGIHRYSTDTYYGGGEWVLLAAWLGWYYAEAGQMEKAREMLAWVENQVDANGCLPEQVPQTMNDPAFYQPWVDRWGPIASPLLWSHAKYIILAQAIDRLSGAKQRF